MVCPSSEVGGMNNLLIRVVLQSCALPPSLICVQLIVICCINTCSHECVLVPLRLLTSHRILSLSVCQRSNCRLELQRLRLSAAADKFAFQYSRPAIKRLIFDLYWSVSSLEGSDHRQADKNPLKTSFSGREDQCDGSSSGSEDSPAEVSLPSCWYGRSQQPFKELRLEMNGPDSSSRPALEVKTPTSPLLLTHLLDRAPTSI